jgi:hypothetical protein
LRKRNAATEFAFNDLKKTLFLVILIFSIFIPCVSFHAFARGETQTYYVAPNGDDSNPGTANRPWQTIQHASDSMVAGETALIRNGVYYAQVKTEHNGSVTSGSITFSAYPGENPVIDGAGVVTGNNGFGIDHSYIRILGLEIRNWPDNGIIGRKAGYLEISDCRIHDVGGGIGLFDGTHDFSINRVTIYNVTMGGFDASPAEGASCFNGVINNCTVHTGRDPEQNCDGFGLGHGEEHNFVFNRCEVYDVFDGFDISAQDTQINSCSSHDNWNTGYKIWSDNVTLTNSISYHNEGNNLQLPWNEVPGIVTLRNCDFVDAQIDNIWVQNSADSLRIYNCILAGGDNVGLDFEQWGTDTYRGDNNIFHNDNPDRAIEVRDRELEFSLDMIAAGNWTSFSGQDQHSLVCSDADTQLFANAANWDFHLKQGSIAVDSGTQSNAPQVDRDNVARPQGVGYDIGSYEFGQGSGTATLTPSASIGVKESESLPIEYIVLPFVIGIITAIMVVVLFRKRSWRSLRAPV